MYIIYILLRVCIYIYIYTVYGKVDEKTATSNRYIYNRYIYTCIYIHHDIYRLLDLSSLRWQIIYTCGTGLYIDDVIAFSNLALF